MEKVHYNLKKKDNYPAYLKKLGLKEMQSPENQELHAQKIYSGKPANGNEVVASLYETHG
jgi:hypothetical protein